MRLRLDQDFSVPLTPAIGGEGHLGVGPAAPAVPAAPRVEERNARARLAPANPAPANSGTASPSIFIARALEALPQGMCLFDGEGRLICANRRFQELYDFSDDLLMPGTPLAVLLACRLTADSAGARPEMLLGHPSLFADGQDQPVEGTVLMRGGRMIALTHTPLPEGGWLSLHEDLGARIDAARMGALAPLGHVPAASNAGERRALEADLRRAIDRDEFELHYQPVIDTRAGTITAFEALIRWNHPERGRLSPVDFIPFGEETGLIIPIGDWVLREACRTAASWPENVRLAVNLSPVQFRSAGLLGAIGRALAESGIAPTRLEVEITDSEMLIEDAATLDALRTLRELGIRLAMDDFGTGYSSLSYLRAFPFDRIKIDRSFIADIARRPDARAIVRAVTDLGLRLGIATIAEGVETREQLERLRAAGCEEVQGYLFSAPRPQADIADMLREGFSGFAAGSRVLP